MAPQQAAEPPCHPGRATLSSGAMDSLPVAPDPATVRRIAHDRGARKRCARNRCARDMEERSVIAELEASGSRARCADAA